MKRSDRAAQRTIHQPHAAPPTRRRRLRGSHHRRRPHHRRVPRLQHPAARAEPLLRGSQRPGPHRRGADDLGGTRPRPLRYRRMDPRARCRRAPRGGRAHARRYRGGGGVRTRRGRGLRDARQHRRRPNRDTGGAPGVAHRIPIRRRRRHPPHARTLRRRRVQPSPPALAGLVRARARYRQSSPPSGSSPQCSSCSGPR